MNISSIDTANLVFRMSHNLATELTEAASIACGVAARFDGIAPGTGWRSEEAATPVSADGLVDLVIPSVSTDGPGFSWGITSGQPPLDLFLAMTVGEGGTRTTGKARLRF